MQNPQDVKLAAEALKERLPGAFFTATTPGLGVALGTGLSSLKDKLNLAFENIPFTEIPGFPAVGAASHVGSFAFALLNGMPLVIQQGRCHLYEGRTPAEVCMGVRLMAALGCRRLIITNAAGALNPLFEQGTLMCMADIINHTGVSPLTGPNFFGDRFPDMSEPFDPGLRSLARTCALELGIPLELGVYIGVHGPEMETAAETRMYRQWGADAVGMSTVLEVIAARHMGMAVLGISCLTNKNLPDCMVPAPLEAIVAAAEAASGDLAALTGAVMKKLSGGETSC